MRRFLTLSILIAVYILTDAFILGHRFGISSGTGGAPILISAPVISGGTTPGAILTTTNGVWSGAPTSYTYEWDSASTSAGPWYQIIDAVASSYTTPSTTGVYYSSIVTATNALGSTISPRSNVIGPMTAPSGGTPVVLGDPTVTKGATTQPTLTVTNGSADCVTNVCSYQWFSNGAQITGANSNSFVLLSTYSHSEVIQATVLENTQSGAFVSVYSSNQVVIKYYIAGMPGSNSQTDPYLTVNGSLPSLSNYPVIGSTITINPGVYDPAPTQPRAYHWGRQNNSTGGTWQPVCVPGTGAPGGSACVNITTQTYTLQDCNGGTLPNCVSDVGNLIRGGEYTQNVIGSTWHEAMFVGNVTEPTSIPAHLAATSSLTVGGATSPFVGYTLTAVPYANGSVPPNFNNFTSPGGPYSYQWYSCTGPGCGSSPPVGGAPIPGATNGYYVLTSADFGKQIYGSITEVDSTGSATGYSVATAAISMPPLPINTAAPIITGLPAYGNVGAGSYGSVLYATKGTWQNNPSLYTFQWYQGIKPDKSHPATGIGATTNVYTVASNDIGKQMWVEVTGHTLVNQSVGDSDSTSQVVAISAPNPITNSSLGVYPVNRDPLNMSGCTQPPTSYANTWYVNSSSGSTPTSQYGGGSFNGGSAGTADGTSSHPFNSLVAMLQGGKNSTQGGQPGYVRPLLSTAVYQHQFASSSDPNPLPWAATHPGVGAHGLTVDSDWNPPGSPQPTGSLVDPGFTPDGSAFVVDSNRINPGDRILVQNADIPAKGMSLSGTNTDLTSGATNWITIAADTGYTPTVSGFSVNGLTQGFNIDGIKVKANPTPVYPLPGSISQGAAWSGSIFTINHGDDIIFTNGTIEVYDDLSEVEADYANDCINSGHGACNATNIGNYLSYTLKKGAIIGNASPPSINHCIALTNSTIKWTYGSAAFTHASDVLFENNDVGYMGADSLDFYTDTTIVHNNFVHDPLALGDGVHNDFMQSQRLGTEDYAYYGLTIDSNRFISKVDSNLAAVPDSQGPGGYTSLANEASCWQTSYGYYTATMFTNNVCNMPMIWHVGNFWLGTFINNTFASNGAGSIGSATDNLDYASYWANNVFSIGTSVAIDCQHSLWTHNVGTPFKGAATGVAAYSGTSCTPTDAMFHIDPLPGNSFTVNNPVSSGYNTPTDQNLTPLTSGALDGTGIAGNGAPTLNVCSTYNISSVCTTQSTRASPPNVGAY